jgi:hypothetical protein
MSENADAGGFDIIQEISLLIMAFLITLAALVYVISKCCSCYYVYKNRGGKININKTIGFGLKSNEEAILNIPSPPDVSLDLEKQMLVGNNNIS